MVETPEMYAGTIDDGKSEDAFSNAMSSLRISGSILLHEDYVPPWAISIPDAELLRGLLDLPRGVRVVDFHFVQRGHIVIFGEGGIPVIVEAGEIAICFGGKAHTISQGEQGQTAAVETILADGRNPFQPRDAEKARSASLICGVFLMRDVELNPLFAALPPVMHLSAAHSSGFSHLAGLLERIALEVRQKSLGSSYVVERLLELLCAEALRVHLATHPATNPGWFSGLKDPVVGRAISLIHAAPGVDWSVDRLAGKVAMSPSRFAARFTAALGESPMAYVSRWRMNVAGRLLSETRESVGNIASEVGYENVPAFNRAFKKHLGIPPAAWRAQHAS